MTNPPPAPSTTPAPLPDRGNAWLGARASLAARRSARFAKVWGLTFGTLTALALLVPALASDPKATARVADGELAADTLRSAQRLREAMDAVTSADSLLVVSRTGSMPAVSAPVADSVANPTVAEFAARITRARGERTAAGFIAVAEHPAVSAGPRMRGLADSLRTADAALRATTVGDSVRRATLAGRVVRIGNTILAIAQNRRAELESSGTRSVAAASIAERTTPPLAKPSALAIDTAAAHAALAAAREALAGVRRAHDSLTSAARALDASVRSSVESSARGPSLAMASPAIAMAVLLVLGLLARFATALNREMSAPTLADATEAERIARAPVLATVREAMLDGPARFHPSGIDPFRILYLGLTATGTRVRTAIISGADPVITAATGARLAIAAAADHRQTLVVDLDAANIPLSRTFRERAEPGTSDALARAFTWREVARPVGSSDGLPIMLLPAGTEREDIALGADRQDVLDDFVRLRGAYELTIVVSPPDRTSLAATLVDAAPVILTAVAGETLLSELEREVAELRAAGRRVQGIVLWDAPRPELPSRAELAALLSKRKGRTPGGSFEAVQRAINPHNSDTKKP